MATQPKAEEKPVAQAPVDQTTQLIDTKSTVPAVQDKLKRKRRLTVDVTNLQKLGQVLCMTQSELYVKELPSQFHPSGKSPAYCVDIVNLHGGEELMLVCNTVLASALQRAGEPLAGRYFAMRCGEVVAGKRYRRVDVVELERAE